MRKWGRCLILLGMVAQLAVPGWMILKRHLILTRGEQVTLAVTLYDPRDLFMGHYVRLSAEQMPPILEDVPTNYLRYYCDQRYAKKLERSLSGRQAAELDVRVWRGSALAEALRINGMPAYDYVAQVQPTVAEPPRRTRDELRYAVLPDNLPRVVREAISWSFFEDLRNQDYTHLRISLDEALLWRDVRKRLGLPREGHPIPPREVREREELARRSRSRWSRNTGEVRVLPIFRGAPFPCEVPFELVAKAYYEAVKAQIDRQDATGFLLEGDFGTADPKAVWQAAQRAYPEAQWLLPRVQVPEGVPAERVILLLPEVPPTPPQGVRWMVMEHPLEKLPEGCVGWGRRIDPLTLPRSGDDPEALLKALQANPALAQSAEWVENFVDTFVVLPTSGARRVADALLMCCPEYTLRAWYDRCDTYADYRELVLWLKQQEADGRFISLGGWAQAAASEWPPEPPEAHKPTAERLLELGREALAPPPCGPLIAP